MIDLGTSFAIDGVEIPFTVGESVLDALVRAGRLPTSGGTLCCGGDCPHCLAIVEGVAYTRTCQTPASPGLSVQRHPSGSAPALPPNVPGDSTSVTYRQADVVVIGAGESGRAEADAARSAGRTVVVLDAGEGQEVIGIYPGPLVVARTADGMVHVAAEEIIVATGAAELQPVCPGSGLSGLMTVGAAERFNGLGVSLGTVVAIGIAPAWIEATIAEGDLVRFEGNGHVEAVVTRAADGRERRYPCDTAVVGLGAQPRDGLARMAGGNNVRVVGDARGPGTVPPCPKQGVVCPCAEVTVDDLQSVWDRGFGEIELVKRATLAGTGTCQGAACVPYLRSFLADRGTELQAAFTARPVSRQVTIGEVSAAEYEPAFPRTALHDEHLALGATMDRIGGWWRPWTYGDVDAEVEAVGLRVSVGDVGTLGKFIVGGPDAQAFLQRIYPNDVSTIRPGRARYAVLLDERGYVMDDGLIARRSDSQFALTSTSGGATHLEMWLRDWAEAWDCDVRIANLTMSFGAINVTGPETHRLLARLGVGDLPPFMGHAELVVAGVPCTVYRVSFTGEVSYEFHHPADRSVELWSSVMRSGAKYRIHPHGLEALEQLRLDKGHILVGLDTDFDSTPRRLDHEWMVDMESGDFLGRDALARIDFLPLDKQLVGLVTEDRPPFQGAVIWHGDQYAGYITSAAYSARLSKGVALGWLKTFEGQLPNVVMSEGQIIRRVPTPFYDPEGRRARA